MVEAWTKWVTGTWGEEQSFRYVFKAESIRLVNVYDI